LHSSSRPSLVSLDNESRVDDNDDDDDDDDSDSDEDNLHDDRASSTTSSVARSEVCDEPWIDGTATPVWHRMLHTLNKVREEKESKIQYSLLYSHVENVI